MPILGVIDSAKTGNLFAGYNSIATVSYPSGTGSDAVFSNIPSAYRTLQIRAFIRHDTRNDNSSTWFLTFNGDTGNNYSYQGGEQLGSGSLLVVLIVLTNLECKVHFCTYYR
jgi:hypothetical protein